MSDTVEPYLWDLRHRLLYEIDLSTLYHRKRERVFDMCDRLAKAVALIVGTAAISKVTSDTWMVPELGALVATTSSMSLIFGYSEKASRHAFSQLSDGAASRATNGKRFTQSSG